MSIAKRVDQLINHYNMSYNSFARSIGMSNGTAIKKMVDYDRNPQNKTLNRICETYPKISYDWLRTGEGAMSKIKTNEIGGLPESMSDNDDLTLTATQVIRQLDINNKHYTNILDKKMSDDRDYYDSVTKSNNSNYSKNIEIILKGFQGLVEKFDKSNKYWSEQNKELKDLFLLTLDKVLHIEQDLENIKSFMAIGFEKQAIKKADKKTAKKLINKKLQKK
ncbi:MAG: DNA-binding Xre family transcriptional regulator [Flavobacteriaceae bacterium]|jgi:DNA-binding Xre family transcriptional regulator